MHGETFFLFFSGAVLKLSVLLGSPLDLLAATGLAGRRAAEKQKECFVGRGNL